MNQLLEFTKASKFAIIFTGAGVSTESGIPDFRSSAGLYSEKYGTKSPQEILSQRTFRKDKKLFFDFYINRIGGIVDKLPNRTHFAIKELEDRGIVKAVLTQNIDNLHQKAGSRKVIDLHGNSTQWYCTSACGFICDYFKAKELMGEEYPVCPECQGVVRPRTVLFDEALSDDAYDTAYFLSKQADLMIAIGSSLVVQPAAGLVDVIPVDAKLVIINKMTTPFDSKADLVIRENCGEVMENLVKELCQ